MRSFCIALVATLVILITACGKDDGRSIPELGRDLPKDIEAGDAAFRERLREHFPAGTPEQTVIDTLVQQGFSLDADGITASFERPEIVCRMVWRVVWSADADHRIKNVDGLYGAICL